MTKQPKNHGKQWTPENIQQMNRLIKHNTPTRVMGIKLGRTPESIYQKASDLGKSVKPVNQSPYNRQKK